MEGDDLKNYPGLYERAGVWYVRKRVPVDLKHLDRREQVRLSLETSERKTAIQRYPFKLAEMEVTFAALRAEHRRRGRVSAALTEGKLERLTRTEIEGLVASWWAQRSPMRQPEASDDPEAIDEAIQSIAEDLNEGTRSTLDGGDPITGVADRLLVSAGMLTARSRGPIRPVSQSPSVDRTTDQYGYLRDLIARALRSEAAMAKDHLLGVRSTSNDPLNPHAPLGSEGSASVPRPRQVGHLIAEYRSERETIHGKESTDRKYGLLFRVLEEVWGRDFPVTDIRRTECVAVRTFLNALPPNATKRFPKLGLSEAVDLARAKGLPGLAPNTVGSYMQNLTAILRWAERSDWGVRPQTDGLVETRKPQVKRRGFSPDELGILFAHLAQFRFAEPSKFWVPALALYTGARAGEVCQLRAVDVVEVQGVPCLNLSEFDAEGKRVPDKRLKNASSERYVPLHAELVSNGFLAFVDAVGAGDALFPDLTPASGEQYSNRFSKWFGRFKRRVGFQEPALVFHSFRHGFRDACRDADIAEETAQALGGWAGLNQATRYGDRARVPNLTRAMQDISFGGFTLPQSP